MRNAGFIWIIAPIMALLDLYVFQAVRLLCQGTSSKIRMVIYGSYWSLSIVVLIVIVIMSLTNSNEWPKNLRNYVLAIVVGLFFAKLIASVFFLIDDIRRLIQWAVGKLFFSNTEGENISGEGISRSVFLSWLGLGIGGGLFSTLLYGFSNKYNYQIH